MDPVNVSAKFAVHVFARSWDNSDCSFGLGLPTPPLVFPKFPHVPLGIGGWPFAMKSEGVGLIAVQLVSKDNSDCSFGLGLPTPPLVSPIFPHVPLWIGGWPFAMKSKGVGLIAVQLVSKDFLPMWSWSATSQTDRRTDDVQSQYRALH